MRAVFRRVSPTNLDEPIDIEGLVLDPVSHRVSANDQSLDMGPTEFRLLHFFMTHPDRVYSREQLLDHVWGTNVYVEDRTVDVHIRRLRKAIEVHGHDRLVQTVRGVGYRFFFGTLNGTTFHAISLTQTTVLVAVAVSLGRLVGGRAMAGSRIGVGCYGFVECLFIFSA